MSRRSTAWRRSTPISAISRAWAKRAPSRSPNSASPTCTPSFPTFPRAYDDRRAYKKIADLIPGENACVCAVIAGEPRLSRIRKGLDLIKLRAVDETCALELTYFNQSYLKNTFHTGDAYVFFGRARVRRAARR